MPKTLVVNRTRREELALAVIRRKIKAKAIY